MTGKRLGYIRVSTIDQNPERQLFDEKLDKTFVDHASGKSTDRPQLTLLLDYAREDDIIIVHSMDRLARNMKDLKKLVDELVDRGIKIHFKKENLTFSKDASPISTLLLHVMGSIAEFEHSLIMERLQEGVARAKAAGKYKGRQRVFNAENSKLLLEKLALKESKSKIAKDLNVSRRALYNHLIEIGYHKVKKKT